MHSPSDLGGSGWKNGGWRPDRGAVGLVLPAGGAQAQCGRRVWGMVASWTRGPEGVEVGFLGCEASVLSVSQAAGVGAQRQGCRQEGHRPGLDSGSQD